MTVRQQPVETRRLEEHRPLATGRRNHDRRSFLKASAVFVAAAGIAAARSFASASVAIAAEGTAGKEKGEKDAAKSLEAARCPVTGKNVSEKVSLDYMGGTLYLHDAGCIAKFKAGKAGYATKANAQLAITGQVRQIGCPVSDGEFDPGIKMKVCGVEVCFCCEDCLEEVKRAPAAKQAEMVFGKGFAKAFVLKQRKQAGNSSSAAQPAGDRWRCSVCGYIHVGSEPPATCPACGATSYSFERMGKKAE